MLKKIKQIIEREKIKHPKNSWFVLLLRRFVQVIYNKLLGIRMFLTKDSTFQSPDTLWMCSLFPKQLLDTVITLLKPGSVLDVGCGTGISLSYFLQNNINALGIENSSIAIEASAVKDKIIKHNLNNELKLSKKFDMVWCFEVIEHIHPSFESNFLQTLINHGDCIILSAARPGQGGHGHFNEQEPEYWIQKFKTLGFSYQSEVTEKLKSTGDMHSENILCFKRV